MAEAAVEFNDITIDNDDEEINEFLTFILCGEEYGVEILRVQEIKGWDEVTLVPNLPSYIRGVINLRGTIVPIIDLRRRFEMDALEYSGTTVVIVLRVVTEGHTDRIMGIVVDGVSDVYQVKNSDMKMPPDFGGQVDTEFVKTLASVGDKLVVILDIDNMLNSDELAVAEIATSE